MTNELESKLKTTLSKLETAKVLFDYALHKAIKATQEAKEELSRDLTKEDILERDAKEVA